MIIIVLLLWPYYPWLVKCVSKTAYIKYNTIGMFHYLITQLACVLVYNSYQGVWAVILPTARSKCSVFFLWLQIRSEIGNLE